MDGPQYEGNIAMILTCPPLLTIIIPTYNSLAQLPACLINIRTVLGDLLGSSVAVLVQDGGSTDGTVEFAETNKARGITFVSEQDKGVYDAMNKAVSKTCTEWVFFLGSDDRLLPGFRQALSRLCSTGVIYYANVRLASNAKRYDGVFSPRKLVFRNICHQSMFIPTRILRGEPYCLEYPIKSDWAQNIQWFAKIDFQHIDLDVAIFNDKGGLSSTYKDSAFERKKPELFRESHGTYLMLACYLAPTLADIFHLAKLLTENFKAFWRNGRGRL